MEWLRKTHGLRSPDGNDRGVNAGRFFKEQREVNDSLDDFGLRMRESAASWKSSGAFFLIWTLLPLGVTALFSGILSAARIMGTCATADDVRRQIATLRILQCIDGLSCFL